MQRIPKIDHKTIELLIAAGVIGYQIYQHFKTPNNQLTPNVGEDNTVKRDDAAEALWQIVRDRLKNMMPANVYELYFQNLKPVKLEESILTLQVPDMAWGKWLDEQFKSLLNQAMHNINNADYNYRFDSDARV